MLGRGDVCRAFDKAPRVPFGGIFAVSTFGEEVQADLSFLDAIMWTLLVGSIQFQIARLVDLDAASGLFSSKSRCELDAATGRC